MLLSFSKFYILLTKGRIKKERKSSVHYDSWSYVSCKTCNYAPCLSINEPYICFLVKVMQKSGKYDVVHELFQKMKRSGEAVKALTYKGITTSPIVDMLLGDYWSIYSLHNVVLVRAYWEEGKVNDAVRAVRDMERRGVIGVSSVYYELARCLCFYGRWQDAILEVSLRGNIIFLFSKLQFQFCQAEWDG